MLTPAPPLRGFAAGRAEISHYMHLVISAELCPPRRRYQIHDMNEYSYKGYIRISWDGQLTMVTISKINSKFARLGISWCGKACALGTHTPRRREAAEREQMYLHANDDVGSSSYIVDD